MSVSVVSAGEAAPYPVISCDVCGGSRPLRLLDPVPAQVRAFLADHRHGVDVPVPRQVAARRAAGR